MPLRSYLAVVAVCVLGSTAVTSSAAVGSVLVYQGNADFIKTHSSGVTYTDFGLATGLAVQNAESLPNPLLAATTPCLILETNEEPFSEAQLVNLRGYVTSGGRIIAMGLRGKGEPEAANVDSTLNAMAASLGATVSFVGNDLDPAGPAEQTTTNISASPFTAGITEILENDVSAIIVNGTAQGLVNTHSGIPFFGGQILGEGLLVMDGGNVGTFNDQHYEAHGYTLYGNGVLASRLCGTHQVPVSAGLGSGGLGGGGGPGGGPAPESTPGPAPSATLTEAERFERFKVIQDIETKLRAIVSGAEVGKNGTTDAAFKKWEEYLRDNGINATINVDASGTVTITISGSPTATVSAASKRAHAVVIARATAVVHTPGRLKFHIALTGEGRAMLHAAAQADRRYFHLHRHGRHPPRRLKLSVKVGFTR
jgi:hypothetical protein